MKKVTGPVGWVWFLVGALVVASGALAQARSGHVRGAERVLIRRGPGTEYQAFATLERGERVEINDLTGDWARVRTAGGQQGYVIGFYLAYSDETPVAVPTPNPLQTAAGATPSPARPAARAAAEVAEAERKCAELNVEVESLRREADNLRKAHPPVPSPGEDVVALRAEVRRLADTTDALRSRLDAPGAVNVAPLAAGEQWSTATIVVTSGATLLLGWIFGSIAARREERHKRTRIRF